MSAEKKRRFGLGPAILVTAAFIGPGTVMSASEAGSAHGFTLLWAVAFSVLATMVLQEMASRLGIVSGGGLSQALKTGFQNRIVRFLVLGLVLVAILVGNAAYQTGNILGAANGVLVLLPEASKDTEPAAVSEEFRSSTPQTSTGSTSELDTNKRRQELMIAIIGAVALTIIWIGRFDVLRHALTALVAIMSLLFIIAAIRCGPDWSQVAKGFIPKIPTGSEWLVAGLIGTTVVPYNLFLHASASAQRWHHSDSETEKTSAGRDWRAAITESRWDTVLSVAIGGVVTCAILITSSVAFHALDGTGTGLSNVQAVAVQLEPALGSWAKTMYAVGLFAAGLTSAITAPIAAGFAASGCFGWTGRLSDWRLKATATSVVAVGVLVGIQLETSPMETIILAQVANGLLLPIIAVFLLVTVNRSDLMKQYVNRRWSNILGVIVVVFVSLIGIKNLYKAWESIEKIRTRSVTAYVVVPTDMHPTGNATKEFRRY